MRATRHRHRVPLPNSAVITNSSPLIPRFWGKTVAQVQDVSGPSLKRKKVGHQGVHQRRHFSVDILSPTHSFYEKNPKNHFFATEVVWRWFMVFIRINRWKSPHLKFKHPNRYQPLFQYDSQKKFVRSFFLTQLHSEPCQKERLTDELLSASGLVV